MVPVSRITRLKGSLELLLRLAIHKVLLVYKRGIFTFLICVRFITRLLRGMGRLST